MPSASTRAAASRSSRRTRLARIACCSSSSGGEGAFTLCFLQRGLGARGLLHQYFERRYVGIPFDERRHRTEARERFRVERPDFGRDARSMIVDAQPPPAPERPYRVAGEMDLADGLGRKRGEVRGGVPAVIAGAHINVVHVAQNAAAGALCDLSKEFPFRDRRMPELQIGGRFLDEQVPLEINLDLFEVPAHALE